MAQKVPHLSQQMVVLEGCHHRAVLNERLHSQGKPFFAALDSGLEWYNRR